MNNKSNNNINTIIIVIIFTITNLYSCSIVDNTYYDKQTIKVTKKIKIPKNIEEWNIHSSLKNNNYSE